MNDALAVLFWWLTIQLAGITVLPLSYRLFHWLPDRGYAFTKALGLLLISYLFWLLNSFGFLHNTAGGILFTVVVVAVFSIQVYRTRKVEDDVSISKWIRENAGYILLVELFFALCLIGWAVFRANNPDITGTEKPMDLAFIEAIIRSDRFPPLDPWLSGFAISYYYFGYAITAMVAKLTTIPATVAFNVGLAWQFAGTLLGGFGVVFNLVAASRKNRNALAEAWQVGFGLLGGIFVGVMGNLEGFLEVLHVNAILPYGFWEKLDILEINVKPPAEAVWPPRGLWWWWRASRVINDLDLAGKSIDLQPIDEFPFFSFLLGDMHPHVLALPFVLLALGLALNWWLKRWNPANGTALSPLEWIKQFVRDADPIFLGVAAICLGSLGFLNTWDFPFFLFIAVGAMTLARLRDSGGSAASLLDTGMVAESVLLGIITLFFCLLAVSKFIRGNFSWAALLGTVCLICLTVFLVHLARQRKNQQGQWVLGSLGQLIVTGAGLLAAGIIAYLPFYAGFRSQAGGILPNVINPTRLSQFFVMFGPFLFILAFWIVVQLVHFKVSWRLFGNIAVGIFLVLLVVAALSAGVAASSSIARDVVHSVVSAAGGMMSALIQTVKRRLSTPWTALFLLGMISSVVALWQTYIEKCNAVKSDRGSADREKIDPVMPFILLLVLTAALLTLAPEFVYLKDNFGVRMNTIFKFYYQAWVMFAVGSCYALYALLQKSGMVRVVAGGGALLLVGAGMFYPVLSIPSRIEDVTGGPTLDGMAYMERVQPSDYAAIRWLQENVDGTPVILEAVDGQYTWGGRISAHTGLPTVLGWAGHEYQWRGETSEPAVRDQDIKTIYTSHLWAETEQLLDKYHIEYVIVGQLETIKYGQAVTTKFERYLEKVFQADGVTIYKWNPQK